MIVFPTLTTDWPGPIMGYDKDYIHNFTAKNTERLNTHIFTHIVLTNDSQESMLKKWKAMSLSSYHFVITKHYCGLCWHGLWRQFQYTINVLGCFLNFYVNKQRLHFSEAGKHNYFLTKKTGIYRNISALPHWDRDKMAATLADDIFNAFS